MAMKLDRSAGRTPPGLESGAVISASIDAHARGSEQSCCGACQAAARDPLLMALVAAVERGDVPRLALTLYAQGSVVAGTVVSRREWLEAWVAVASTSDPGEGTVAKVLRRWLDNEAGAQDGQLQGVDHIHLVGATVLLSGGTTGGGSPQDGELRGLWRGRLSEVTAWQVA